jgi:STAM-binding protein
LVANKLPSHPSAKDLEIRPAFKAVQKTLPDVIQRLEQLKPRINTRYETWQRAEERRREIKATIDNDVQPSSRNDFASSDPAIAGNTTTLAAGENRDLAVKLAHHEIRRRDAARRATRQAGVSEKEERERRIAGLWDNWDDAYSGDNDLQKRMEATRKRLDGSVETGDSDGAGGLELSHRSTRPTQASRNGHSSYKYPSISKSQPLVLDGTQMSSAPNRAPPKPPKYDDQPPPYTEPPPLPGKVSEPKETTLNMMAPAPSPSFTFRPSAYLENGNPLRTVFLPPTLRTEFLHHAVSNTRANLETCGMLCGTLISNALFISALIIPEQISTSDTCETVNETAFFDYCMQEEYLMLGWIHTHPTQTT